MKPIPMQKTLKSAVACKGVGVHSGAPAHLTIKPAEKNTGFVFIRTDITNQNNRIAGLWSNVTDTKLCTVLSNKDGISISTVEHILSALAALGVDNALVEVDGPEIPIMDGSAAPFVDMIDRIGLQTQNAAKRFLRLKKSITVEQEGKSVTLIPSLNPTWHMEIEFDSPVIGLQTYKHSANTADFRKNIANCRTFGFLHEVEMLQKMGLARGGTLDNAIVIDGAHVLNPDGLRHKDEFVRHKILDAIGDLILAGAPILANYQGVKAGHALNNLILQTLFADKDAFEFISAERLFNLPKPTATKQINPAHASDELVFV